MSSATRVEGTYGKTKVRIVRVRRPSGSSSTYNELTEVHAEVLLEGDFLESYTEGDNSRVVPTDTIKNTCYILAKTSNFNSIEDFGLSLIHHFLARHSHIHAVTVSLQEKLWSRVTIGGTPHEHVFKACEPESYTAVCRGDKNGSFDVVSGIKDLKVIKTTQSGFENYLKDEYTSLEPVKDRIFCTCINTSWRFGEPQRDFETINKRVRQKLLEVYAGPPYGGVYSKSVQETMYLMAEEVLRCEPSIKEVELVLPNIHHFHFDLSRFRLVQDVKNQIFFPTDDPSGLIKCKVVRGVPSLARL